MKKVVYLYILLTLSSLGTLSRLYTAFFSSIPQLEKTGDTATDTILAETIKLAELNHTFSTSIFSRTLVILMLVAILVGFYYLIKRNSKAILAYLFYLALTLLESILGFIHANQVVGLYSDETLAQSAKVMTWMSLGTSLGTLVLFLLIIYVNSRASKKES